MDAPHFSRRLPWPPSGNCRCGYSQGAGNRARWFRTPAYRAFIDATARLCHNCDPFAATQDLVAELVFYPPDRRKRDLDNLLKTTLDALEAAGVFPDDHQIKAIRAQIEPHNAEVEPGVDVMVRPL